MTPITQRLCTLCGVERPIDTFERTGQAKLGPYRKTCSIDHDAPDLSTRLKKAEKRRRRNAARVSRSVKSEIQQEQYDRARHRGPRRVTQLKASRLPIGTPSGMTANDYAIYLTGPHWTAFRDAYRAAYDYVCFVCGDPADDLHHITYDRVGGERKEDVVPLCRSHHKETHDLVKSGHALGIAHILAQRNNE